jgi:hypothetical protein
MTYADSALGEYERKYVGMLDELRAAPEVEVLHEKRGPLEDGDWADITAMISDEFPETILDPTLERVFLRFEVVACHWGIERGGTYLTGEFSLRHLGAAMFATVEDLGPEDDGAEFDERLFGELHPFDEHTKGGGGTLAGLRVQPGVPAHEVLFYNGTSRWYQLDLDCCGYFDALLMTKGSFGWQYLFAAVDQHNDDFQFAVENLQNMLRVFPEIFPGHNYEPFRARLADRLR